MCDLEGLPSAVACRKVSPKHKTNRNVPHRLRERIRYALAEPNERTSARDARAAPEPSVSLTLCLAVTDCGDRSASRYAEQSLCNTKNRTSARFPLDRSPRGRRRVRRNFAGETRN